MLLQLLYTDGFFGLMLKKQQLEITFKSVHIKVFISKGHMIEFPNYDMSCNMWFPTMWHFEKCNSDKSLQPPAKHSNSKRCSVSSLIYRIFKRLAKALIRLHICAGLYEAFLLAHTTLLEIPCHRSFGLMLKNDSLRLLKCSYQRVT